MLRPLVFAPMLVYLGLTLTYMASEAHLESLFRSAHSPASSAPFHRLDESSGEARQVLMGFDGAAAALIVTDIP